MEKRENSRDKEQEKEQQRERRKERKKKKRDKDGGNETVNSITENYWVRYQASLLSPCFFCWQSFSWVPLLSKSMN